MADPLEQSPPELPEGPEGFLDEPWRRPAVWLAKLIGFLVPAVLLAGGCVVRWHEDQILAKTDARIRVESQARAAELGDVAAAPKVMAEAQRDTAEALGVLQQSEIDTARAIGQLQGALLRAGVVAPTIDATAAPR